MGTDTAILVSDLQGEDWFLRYIPVGRLRELLASVPPDARLSVNRVGNLLVWLPAEDGQWVADGYIDLADERYERF